MYKHDLPSVIPLKDEAIRRQENLHVNARVNWEWFVREKSEGLLRDELFRDPDLRAEVEDDLRPEMERELSNEIRGEVATELKLKDERIEELAEMVRTYEEKLAAISRQSLDRKLAGSRSST